MSAWTRLIGGERRVFAGLMTQVLPQTSAGKSFQRGDGHGEVPGRDHAADADRHADGHGEFVLQLGGGGLAEETAALAGHVEGGVDGFLHVAAGLGQDLAHFAGHVAGVLFLALEEELAGAVEDLGALGRGNEPPGGEGFRGGGDGVRRRLRRAEDWKLADDVVVVGRD